MGGRNGPAATGRRPAMGCSGGHFFAQVSFQLPGNGHCRRMTGTGRRMWISFSIFPARLSKSKTARCIPPMASGIAVFRLWRPACGRRFWTAKSLFPSRCTPRQHIPDGPRFFKGAPCPWPGHGLTAAGRSSKSWRAGLPAMPAKLSPWVMRTGKSWRRKALRHSRLQPAENSCCNGFYIRCSKSAAGGKG